MVSRNTQQPKKSKWRRMVLAVGGLGVAVASVCAAKTLWLAPANAQPATPGAAARPQPASVPQPAPTPNAITDYSATIVASYHPNHNITREDLGNYLIDRRGMEKIDTLVSNRIIEKACHERGITVTGAEVEQRFAEDLKSINIDRAGFVKQFLTTRAKKNLYEWKEDVLRPQLQLAKLCRDRTQVTDEEIRNGYEARYGEKVDCRVIHWENKTAAEAEYARVHDDEQIFAEIAKHQHTSALASTVGKIAAFGRHNMENVELENAAFALQPGEVSPLIAAPDGGYVVIKCDARIPANVSVNLDSVKATIKDEIADSKVRTVIKDLMPALRKEAAPQIFLRKPDATLDPSEARPSRAATTVVATIFGTIPITRQDLGDFLIQRFGGEQLEMLVNKRLIDDACQAANVTVTPEEIEVGFYEDVKRRNLTTEAEFIEQYLTPNKTTAYQWREDVVRTRLLLAKLCRNRVQVTEGELQMAFDAYHGEKVECRMILWPRGGEGQAMQNYAKLRDDPKAFDQLAAAQMSSSLSKNEGRVTIGRHTTGNEELERKAFALKEGEVSELFGTPEGSVLLRCDHQVPPDTSVKLLDCRDALYKEVLEKKIQQEMPKYFAEMRKLAQPQLNLHDPNRPEQMKEQIEEAIKDVPVGGLPARGHR